MGRMRVPNPTRYNLTLPEVRNERDLLPDRGGMHYHHIIQHEVLRDFWNNCVEFNLEQLGETLVPELRRSMWKYPLVRPDPATVKTVLDMVDPLLRTIWGGQCVHDPAPAAIRPPPIPVMTDTLRAVYLWMPGNLFVGPKKPEPKGGRRFDTFASRVVEPKRYLDVLRAQQAIQEYLETCRAIQDDLNQGKPAFTADPAGTERRAQTAQLAHAAGLALARVAKYNDMTAHDPAAW